MALLGILVRAITYLLSNKSSYLAAYDHNVFYPFQSFRNRLFGLVPFSIGDVVYILGGLWLLITLIRWTYYIIKFRAYKEFLAFSVIGSINTILYIYLFFLIGWGGNYYKQPLRKYWHLDSGIKHKTDNASLIAFDRFLLGKLNAYAPGYHPRSWKDVNIKAGNCYKLYTDCKVKNGLDIKPTLFGNIMERFDIEGYYNPFTGEGQVNTELPPFMLPFTICHEMAHQAGIAAEEDANLMAYAVGTVTTDSSFNYSCYLNVWLYTNNRLFFHDSALARQIESQINPITSAHLDNLEAINRKYHSDITKYSGVVYDSYLRMQHQQEGIHSYGNVASSAWQLEKRRMAGKREKMISIP